MRGIALILLASLLACTEAGNAQQDAEAAQDPAAALASNLEQAIERGDEAAFRALVKFDGTNDEVQQVFARLSGGILGRGVNAVTLEPPSDQTQPYDFNGTRYELNGDAVGEVKVDFAMDNPNESETFSMAYGLEDGRAVILLAAPAGPAAGEE